MCTSLLISVISAPSLGPRNNRPKIMWKKHIYSFFYEDGNYIMI